MRRKYMCAAVTAAFVMALSGCGMPSTSETNSVSGNNEGKAEESETAEKTEPDDPGESPSDNDVDEASDGSDTDMTWIWHGGFLQDENDVTVSDDVDYCMYEDYDIDIDYMYSSYGYGEGYNLVEEFGLDDVSLLYGLGYLEDDKQYPFDRYLFFSITSNATSYADLTFSELIVNGISVPVTSRVTLSPESTVQVAIRCQIEDMDYFDDIITVGGTGNVVTDDDDGNEVILKTFNFLGRRVSDVDLIDASGNDAEEE